MSYRIEWLPTTLQRFATDFEKLHRAKQREVVDALADVDFRLMNLPIDSGESRASPFERVLFAPPIMVLYRIDPRGRLAEIVDAKMVWKTD